MTNKNLQSPTKLTEFAPLQPEEKQQTVTQLISKFFKLNRFNNNGQSSQNPETSNYKVVQENLPAWAVDNTSENEKTFNEEGYPEIADGRSLPNVLKRISSLLALNKTSNSPVYSEQDLKQYWMPDSVSKECYECCEKFTTFRRRHHCRVCGQIFCSQCCNVQIAGKIFGTAGYLRACMYCCKIVIGYLESLDLGSDLTVYLKQLQEIVDNKQGLHHDPSVDLIQSRLSSADLPVDSLDVNSGLHRKVSVGYQEEKFVPGSTPGSFITIEERCKALQNSTSLRNLYEEICRPTTGIILRKQKYRLRTYSDCFLGSELVDWLIRQQKANTRIQACTFCQALLEGGYVESVFDSTTFIDGFALYKLGIILPTELSQPMAISITQDEPNWVKFIPLESEIADCDSDPVTPTFVRAPGRLTSSSSYTLDLNVEANTVYISKPMPSNHSTSSGEETLEADQQNFGSEISVVRTTEQREKAPESGWYNPSQLREENNEKLAYNLLQDAFKQHENNLLKQLLNQEGLNLSWAEVLLPLVHEIVDLVRPDLNHNAEAIDICHYVKFKKVPGGTKLDCKLVRGIIFTKNIVHKSMLNQIDNPKVLLLEGAVVYQRIEGRLMSLEPILMQEQESLRNLAAKIIALKPDIVLVQRNVARLAQDILREQGVTLVINVKRRILEALSRCMQADLITSLDAHLMGKPTLGTCNKFYLQCYKSTSGEKSKTLMCFEGLPQPHLSSTILLRGASKIELQKVKRVASLLLFTCYNWRLEKSFLMDFFALPPHHKNEFFCDSGENSPTLPENFPIKSRINYIKSEDKFDDLNKTKREKNSLKVVECFTDPLNSYDKEEEIIPNENFKGKLSVADLPFSNQFRKHLDDTILCVSPYVTFSVPYLETENGRKCKLRSYYPDQIFSSEQFLNTSKKVLKTVDDNLSNKQPILKIKPPHPFITTVIGRNIDSNEIKNSLAHFRACGGRYEKKPSIDFMKNQSNDEKLTEHPAENSNKQLDVFDPHNHQKLDALYYSFSYKSANAPAFCVNPWVVHMSFYRDNDIPLGCFLEKYCFRKSYGCQSKSCGVPMLNHIRRFVHNSGCISISLDELPNSFTEDRIIMWSWCSKCQTCSPSVPMSGDTWSFSLAKYLELRFHNGLYTRRGNVPCNHSLHQDNLQYFSYNNIVATFEYLPVDLWEISLPPTIISFVPDRSKQHLEMIEEIKTIALKGHEIFSLISEKLSILSPDFDGLNNYKQMLLKDQLMFKEMVELVQWKLTSPTLEKTEDNFGNPESKDAQMATWKISDTLVRIKKLIAEAVDQWNLILQESIKKRDADKRKERSSHSEIDSHSSSDVKSSATDSEFDIKDSKSGASNRNRSLDQEHVPPSPKSHHRSQSDGTILSQYDDSYDGKKHDDRKTVKHIFSQLLPSATAFTPILHTFNPQEHYTLPIGVYFPIIVYENEPSSIIAYALNTFDYKRILEEFATKKIHQNEPSPSPSHKRLLSNDKDKRISSGDKLESHESSSGLLSFLRNKDVNKVDGGNNVNVDASQGNDQTLHVDKIDDSKKRKSSHIEIQFEDSNCNFFCRIYFAEEFTFLRSYMLPSGEEAFIRSLTRSIQWNARGGKSGSTFCKTTDDRFILKEMPKSEIQLFLEFAPNYFSYMNHCHDTSQPTLLGKIVGIYQIIFKNNSTNASLRTHVLVMENLFYNRTITQRFDLKGSMRNRLVNPDNQDEEIVLLDENLLYMSCDSPLYIFHHSKAVLAAAIQKDIEFLSAQSVMDYSLLVGRDTNNKELVVGIIDYIRTFTWDKRLETMVKKSGILWGQGKLPTIVSPEEYRDRFIEAMHKYFLQVPDPWMGFGKSLEY
ncbi:1-phosphatidylinositol 3-phosphate 5-kinase [Onthophagus taurus]|uniref:1-phosphatidylinositol 3-phosphate 5-kinase n=1 Tax=Onthophagus taurus TaxID=166361 RepID=UPI0039BE9ABC